MGEILGLNKSEATSTKVKHGFFVVLKVQISKIPKMYAMNNFPQNIFSLTSLYISGFFSEKRRLGFE